MRFTRRELIWIAIGLISHGNLALAASPKREHRIVFQLTDNDPPRMTMVLDNIANVSRYYADKGDQEMCIRDRTYIVEKGKPLASPA